MKSLLLAILFFLFAFNAKAQQDKEGAKDFFKTVVKTFFDKDCDKLYSLFNDTVTIVNPYREGIAPSAHMVYDRKACEKFDEFTEGLGSFEKYTEDYKIIVLNRKEFISTSNKQVEDQIMAEGTDNGMVYEILQEMHRYYTDNDYLVFGNIHNSDQNKNIGRGLFWMIVRKTPTGWKIFGTRN